MQKKKYWILCLFFVLTIFFSTSEKKNAPKEIEKGNNREQSVTQKKVSKKNLPKRHGRILIGRKVERFEHPEEKLPLINSPDPLWKDLAKKNLLRHRSRDAEIHIKVLGSYIKIKNGKGRFVEKILVTQSKKGRPGPSFNAIVDSQTGRILSTFNRTIHEYFVPPAKFQWTVRPLLAH